MTEFEICEERISFPTELVESALIDDFAYHVLKHKGGIAIVSVELEPEQEGNATAIVKYTKQVSKAKGARVLNIPNY